MSDRTTALVVADLHLHHLPAWRWEWCEQFIGKLLTMKQDHYLFLLGDVFEVRDRVDSRVLNLFLKLCLEWENEVVWVAGQHDSYLPGRATLEALNLLDAVHVVDREVFCFQGGPGQAVYFVPFYRDREQLERALQDWVPDGARVMTHTPTQEILREYGAQDVSQYPEMRLFDRFEHTWSGDIHQSFDFPKLSYLGAPSQRDWRDAHVEGVIGFYDLVTGEMRRESVNHPKHIEVESMVEVSTDGQYIVKVRDGNLSPRENVLAAIDISASPVVSVEVEAPSGTYDLVDAYVKENPHPKLKESDLVLTATQLLKESSDG